jgi:hypothetical protein
MGALENTMHEPLMQVGLGISCVWMHNEGMHVAVVIELWYAPSIVCNSTVNNGCVHILPCNGLGLV